MRKEYLMLGLIFALLMLNLVSAEVQTLGNFKQNTCVSLVQTCSNCTFVNLTSVTLPDSSVNNLNVMMTQTGYNYNYSYCTTTSLGKYIATTCGDIDGENTCVAYDFIVTPSGSNFGSNGLLGLTIIVMVIIYGIAFFGFFGRNEWISVLGGMAMIILGLYTINNGIDVYRNFVTDALSWITIGLGAIFAITAGVEIIQDNLE